MQLNIPLISSNFLKSLAYNNFKRHINHARTAD